MADSWLRRESISRKDGSKGDGAAAVPRCTSELPRRVWLAWEKFATVHDTVTTKDRQDLQFMLARYYL